MRLNAGSEDRARQDCVCLARPQVVCGGKGGPGGGGGRGVGARKRNRLQDLSALHAEQALAGSEASQFPLPPPPRPGLLHPGRGTYKIIIMLGEIGGEGGGGETRALRGSQPVLCNLAR